MESKEESPTAAQHVGDDVVHEQLVELEGELGSMVIVSFDEAPPTPISCSLDQYASTDLNSSDNTSFRVVYEDSGCFSDDELLAPPTSEETGGTRNYTPVRVRPHSQPKARPVPVVNAPLRRARRVIGRRKDRRWENDRMIGRGQYMDPLSMENFSFKDLAELAGNVKIEWKSNFAELTSKSGESLRDQFVDCDPRFATKPTNEHQAQYSTMAEKMMGRVERKLRYHLNTTGVKPQFLQFLIALERYLMIAFESFPRDEDLRQRFMQRLVPSLHKDWDTSKGKPKRTKDKKENLMTKESTSSLLPQERTHHLKLCFATGIHRILAHALCEFHGLSSCSQTDSKRRRVTVISHPGLHKTSLSAPEGEAMVVGESLPRYLVTKHGGDFVALTA